MRGYNTDMKAAQLYERDFFEWTQCNAALLRAGRFDQVKAMIAKPRDGVFVGALFNLSCHFSPLNLWLAERNRLLLPVSQSTWSLDAGLGFSNYTSFPLDPGTVLYNLTTSCRICAFGQVTIVINLSGV